MRHGSMTLRGRLRNRSAGFAEGVAWSWWFSFGSSKRSPDERSDIRDFLGSHTRMSLRSCGLQRFNAISFIHNNLAPLGRDPERDLGAGSRNRFIVRPDRNPDHAAAVEPPGNDQLGTEE